jgi:single-strand DNA-binding protein
MNGMNRVILLGNLGTDPELRYTAAGIAVLNLRLATNESFFDKNKEPQERTEWHSIVVWGTRAEALSKTLNKGACVLVEGGLRTSSFEKDGGGRRYKTEVYAREVVLVGRRMAAPGSDVPSSPDDPNAPTLGTMRVNGFVPSKKEEMLAELPY